MAVPDVPLPEDTAWAKVESPEPRVILDHPGAAGTMMPRVLTMDQAWQLYFDLRAVLRAVLDTPQAGSTCETCPCQR